MPGLADPNFDRAVTYICQHDSEGAIGIVINRQIELTYEMVFKQMQVTAEQCVQLKSHIHYGGPVNMERGFVLHNEGHGWDSTLKVTDEIGLTTSKDILEAIARNQGPDNSLIALGYAGWAAGQLEHEIIENTWLNGPVNSDILFQLPVAQRWEAALDRLGIDPANLSTEAGHA